MRSPAPRHLRVVGAEGVDNAMYQRLVASAPDYAIFLLDPQGVVRSWNLGGERILGYRAEQIIGQHFSRFYPREQIDGGLPMQGIEIARRTGRHEEEGWRLRQDGARFWANILTTCLMDADGEVLGFAKIIRDITERRTREEMLRHSEERFRLMVESVRDYAIFMLDPGGHIVSWNKGAERTKGYRADEIIGEHFSVFYPPDVAASGWPQRELEIALADGRVEDEGWRVRKDGTRFWASVVITALHDSTGRHVGFAKVTRDLSDKRRVLALEDEGRRVTTFLAMLGHELRNPLAPISNAVSLLQAEPLESDNARMCREVIARQTAQLTRLVDDLLDVGRITNGKIHLELKHVDLAAALHEVVDALSVLVHERGHVVIVNAPATPLWVIGDRARLLQVMSNLLNNAAKFTPNGGRISASLRRSGDHAEIAIADNGPGIPAARIDEIFRPFVQGPQNAAHDQGGLGLGLSVVQHLVGLHDGTISVFSSGTPGQGAEFVVRLPLAPAAQVLREEPPAAAVALSHHVLIVDDNHDAADTLGQLLRHMGHSSRIVYDGRSALEAIAAQRPDLVLLDLGLPDIDGLEIARHLHAEMSNPPPIVALTGYGQSHDRDATLEAGFHAHLTKPLTAPALASLLHDVFG